MIFLFCFLHLKSTSIDPVRGKFHVAGQSFSPNRFRRTSAGEVVTKAFSGWESPPIAVYLPVYVVDQSSLVLQTAFYGTPASDDDTQ